MAPNDLINTDGKGRFVFTVWSAKVLGTVELPYQMRMAATVREQSGSHGRTFDATLNYGTVRTGGADGDLPTAQRGDYR